MAPSYEAVARVLGEWPDVAYGLVFGSLARDRGHPGSDLDVAIGTTRRLDALEIGALVAALEGAAARAVDLVVLEDAPAPLAYRVFRDGRELLVRDRARLVAQKAGAIVAYLDFKPVEDRCSRGVLEAAARG